MSEILPIPGPRALPVIGNAHQLGGDVPLVNQENLADTYGPIFQVTLGGRRVIFVSSHALYDELCNENRFQKKVAGALGQVRNGVKDGLFTAHKGEVNWAIAHRILIPAFGPLSIRGMFDQMFDIAGQLTLKWSRLPRNTPIHVSDDFTRLALDTLALCAMGARFNSYYSNTMHPFIDAMGDFLKESGQRSSRPPIMNHFMSGTNQKYFADIQLMRELAQDLVNQRREEFREYPESTEKKDLLNAMLLGKDKQTGQTLDDEVVINNMITFLIAGHETTSGTLSFAFYELLRQPEAMKKAQEEVDRVCGQGKITVDQITKLPYINAVLREVLRLNSPITANALGINPDAHEDPHLLGGEYKIEESDSVIAMIHKIHRDPAVYGADAEEFKPERMLDEEFNKLPKNAWKPFGNGVRGCIGRPFAWQEMQLVMAMLLQNFTFTPDDASYMGHLQLKQTLTIKPKDFNMRVTLRNGISATELEHRLHASASGVHETTKLPQKDTNSNGTKSKGKPMKIYFGSNTGTCEAFAHRLASDARRHGYEADVDALDSAIEKINKDAPIIVITASYEGQPPDNAAHFFTWLNKAEKGAFTGTKFAVFGCGHHDWAATFQRIPTEISKLLKEFGAEEICERGSADAAGGDMFSAFDDWEDKSLWPAMGADEGGVSDTAAEIEVTVDVETRPAKLGQQLQTGLVLENTLLNSNEVEHGDSEKRHLEIQLPTDMEYKVGDYLAILPTNPPQDVKRAMRRFNLPWDAILTIDSSGPTNLPTAPISAGDLFSSYVELSLPATKRDLTAIANVASDKAKAELMDIINNSDKFAEEIVKPRVSPLDLLEKYSDVQVPLNVFISMLPLMRVRQYSISSSPLVNPTTCTLTVSVLKATSTASERQHIGVASNFLASLEKGDRVQVSVRKSHGNFTLPLEVATVPVIMIAAGTGIAPFRGFIQERAAQIGGGRKLAPALLFFGCRRPKEMYDAELRRWEEAGAVKVYYAFSREAEASEGCKYVQHRLWKERDAARELFDQGGKIYVCGSKSIGQETRDVCVRIAMEVKEKKGEAKDQKEMEAWFDKLGKERFATDVFA